MASNNTVLGNPIMTDYPIHPACALWPRPSDEEVLAIAADIKANGLLNPIWLYEGAILDGKTRFEACGIAGVEPRFETYAGDDPVGFTIAQNARRRQLSVYDLAGIVAKLCTLSRGGDRGNQYTGGKVSPETLPLKKAANAAGIAHQTILDRKVLDATAEPNVIKMVRDKQVGLRAAATYAQKTPRKDQHQATPKTILNLHLSKTNKVKTRKQEQMITIPQRDVVDKLRPLIKRVKEQSKRHTGTVSLTELGFIAHELKILADSWMKDGSESETRSESVSHSCVQKGG